jgi:CO dehydrogenase nickel-insertion accessory protein CooC1
LLNKAYGDVEKAMLKELDSSRLVGILPMDQGLFLAGLKGEEIEDLPAGLERLFCILEGN